MGPQAEDNEQDNDALDPSPDDDLEAARGNLLNTTVGDDALLGDNDSPMSDPAVVPGDPTNDTPTTDDTHPSNDTDTDETETYNQGL